MKDPEPQRVESQPVLVFCPYLQLQAPYEFAGWWIGPLDSFDGPWNPPELREAATELLARFVDVGGKTIARPTLVASIDGISGEPPPDIEALALAIALGSLARNPHGPQDDDDRQSWRTITTDNADLWVQPVDLEHRRLALTRGYWVRTLAGGYRFDDLEFSIPPPLELHVDGHGDFDPEIAGAAYRILSTPDKTPDEPFAKRLKQAIRWWLRSWLNSPSLMWEDRIVQLRIAVDALVGSDRTNDAVTWLTDLFGGVLEEARGAELLWDPAHPQFGRPHKGQVHDVPAFEHWFRSFADRRNEIVHEGEASATEYTVDGSPYVGNYLEVAERLVFEAILVSMHRLVPGHYWRSQIWRALFVELESDEIDAEPS